MMIDFHSHILPGIDDGARDVETSLAMLQASAADGVTHLVATPHFYPTHEDPDRFLHRRALATVELAEACRGISGMPQVYLGAEVEYFTGISHYAELSRLCIAGTQCLLIEMPFTKWSAQVVGEVVALRERGFIPIIAHVERYPAPRDALEYLVDNRVLLQSNAEVYCRFAARGRMLRMVARRQIHLFGSDCHNLDTRRPGLSSAREMIEKKCGAQVFSAAMKLGEFLLRNAQEIEMVASTLSIKHD